jgi:hypothetical protein
MDNVHKHNTCMEMGLPPTDVEISHSEDAVCLCTKTVGQEARMYNICVLCQATHWFPIEPGNHLASNYRIPKCPIDSSNSTLTRTPSGVTTLGPVVTKWMQMFILLNPVTCAMDPRYLTLPCMWIFTVFVRTMRLRLALTGGRSDNRPSSSSCSTSCKNILHTDVAVQEKVPYTIAQKHLPHLGTLRTSRRTYIPEYSTEFCSATDEPSYVSCPCGTLYPFYLARRGYTAASSRADRILPCWMGHGTKLKVKDNITQPFRWLWCYQLTHEL